MHSILGLVVIENWRLVIKIMKTNFTPVKAFVRRVKLTLITFCWATRLWNPNKNVAMGARLGGFSPITRRRTCGN